MFKHIKTWLAEKLGKRTLNVEVDKTRTEITVKYIRLFQQQEHKIAELEAKVEAYEAQQGNGVLADIQQLFVKQTEKGIRKYGDTVKVDNLSAVEWCQHALEECADNMVYLSSLKKKLERGEL
ncbi:hypothetical protein FH508_0008570 [Lysinibacillus sp. CD3-6]|uniref:hypothetical protein n=1 Tax=Lysinibacillus sp. CD3-6 TaxID=2892541 RepID=UPI001124BC81|nr:hypothetical protein [Lysinibacillus sp. CD3-6]UED81934.1 hypothetical protein FH508_0008570 [Lysinibacillus sp. CD3-6]